MAGSQFAGAAVAEQVPLAPMTTLRVGPVARRVITCTSSEQVVAVLRELRGEQPLVLAGGSNVVIADDLTDLTVVRLASTGIEVRGNVLRAEAGAVWDDVVTAAVRANLGGLECLSGIPGSAGATPVQNVGAYGAEVADTISRVRLLDRQTGDVHWVTPQALQFGYRSSVLKGPPDAGKPIALEVEFTLDDSGRGAPLRYGELAKALDAQTGDRRDPALVRATVLRLRRGKAMVLDPADHDTWSVGSFFTNPVVSPAQFEQVCAHSADPVPNYPAGDQVKLAAGWLVERAGFGKGFPDAAAPVRLSTRHALAITNRGAATSADVIALARTVRDGVFEAFGIRLEPEPVLVGLAM